MDWRFVLRFRLPADGADPAGWLDALFEAGCDDATVGVGRPGLIALDFTRTAATARAAVETALADVARAIPGVQLIEVSPDLVSLVDVADAFGCSKQNIQKYAAGQMRSVKVPFPAPVHAGSSSLWRMAEVLDWFDRHTDLHPPPALKQVAATAFQVNMAQWGRFQP